MSRIENPRQMYWFKIFAYNLLLDVAVIDTCIVNKGMLRGMNSEAYPYFFFIDWLLLSACVAFLSLQCSVCLSEAGVLVCLTFQWSGVYR